MARRGDFDLGDLSHSLILRRRLGLTARSVSASRPFPGGIVRACILTRSASCAIRSLKETACVV
jgi:hypothetical protein